ncbi:MAG: alanine--tRNA ligase [Oenococcus sp.]|uniref:alanine--tRNA ligase n=1 Tax=Oenococcus TaxID=46254 RepID=UPI0021E8382F|nr:alanine--tRNA ligase [Oenococcus kitaharae]MCV3295954.1 alanine--tRNA ligase [Oenococcus kitaharae]
MKKLDSAQIRRMFLDFFQSKGHKIEPSQSLIPKDDPSLLWINSGVATLKKYFDGSVVPENPRITNAQKSIRTNDIENVGHTARHHTFFEMLGNFSVGDYFKKEVIPWAWELLTSPDWFAIEPEKLYITYYPRDTETKALWEAQPGFLPNHTVAEESNFWDIGEGPSGPDTEIFFDRGPKFQDLPDDDPEMYPGGENERYLEIWNIVFSQFNHLPGMTDNSQYPELPHKNIDTGMGLERVVSIFENAPTNFETDLFLPIIHKVESLSGQKYGQDKTLDVSFKVIADHVRAVTFAISDGALPGNSGRGYVIRRLLRRAVMHGRKLGIEKPFLTQLVPIVGQIMSSYYPEILANQHQIIPVIKAEEDRFDQTLTAGLALLDDDIQEAKDKHESELSGAKAFKLFDTYGFPLELTEEQAVEAGLKVDRKGFETEMKAQQDRARKAQGKLKTFGVQDAALMNLKVPSEYVGWSQTSVDDTEINAIIVDDKQVDQARAGQQAVLVFAKTPFYAEMGGQVADHGTVKSLNGQLLGQVLDVQNGPNKQHIHTVKLSGDVKVGQQVALAVDMARHLAVSKNHTATHLLDQALRNVIGGNIHQAGSLVETDYLRFDFTHQGAVSQKTLDQIEDQVNQQIALALPITWIETDIESAKKLGAVAVFGEKYGKKVRVVSIGDYNKEFDGGTHASNTSELGLFKIVSESGTGAGTRRIEAVTGQAAFRLFKQHEDELKKTAAILETQKITDVPEKVAGLIQELKDSKKALEALSAKAANQAAEKLFDSSQTVNGISYVAAQIDGQTADGLRLIVDDWRAKQVSDLIILASNNAGSPILVAASRIPKQIKAGDLIKNLAVKIQGGGGGRPDLAQAGGKNPAGIKDALSAVKQYLQNL